MPRVTNLRPGSPWVELTTTAQDWEDADPSLLSTMLCQLHLIRAFEESVLELAAEGLVNGPAHSSIGQEGGAVGSAVGLRSTDAVNGSHRGHHQFLAKSLAHVSPSLDTAGFVSDDVQALLQRTLAEILGLAQGFCAGRGGSMHLQWREAGALGTNAIVGGGVPQATGNAWAQRHAQVDDVTITYFGDGAINIGSTLESFNLAAAWRLPVCFFVENNLYAVSTHVDEATGEPRLSARGPGFNIPSWRVDGMDPLAVHLATSGAIAHMRAGEGPTLVEAEVYRYFHQNGPYPGSAFGYRTKEEEQEWRARDPLDRTGREMTKLGLVDDAALEAVRKRANEAMTSAVEALVERDPKDGSGKRRRIRPELWPETAFVDIGVRGDLSEIADSRIEEEVTFSGSLVDQKFVDVIAKVLDRRMEQDDRIVLMGEDVHRLNGGTNGATKGLAAKYPARVLGTPISENSFSGAAGGIALHGRFRPVVEFMYADFLWVAADQLFNQIGKARHMFGGQNEIPIVLRSKVAMGTGYGSQHSMDPAGIFATSPGWRIVAPSTPFDYVGLMNTALALNDPVVVLEHVDLYTSKGPAPVDDLDYQLPFGKAALRRTGKDATIISYLSMVNEVIEAVEREGFDADVIDLRWLDRASLDWETIEESVKKTNAVLIVEQGAVGTSYGGWLADEIHRRLFDWLDQPVQRVTGGEASPSISKVLERAAFARADEVVTGIDQLREGMGG